MSQRIQELVDSALREDIGTGDITTQATVPEHVQSTAVIGCKQDLVVSGLDVARQVFAAVDGTLAWQPRRKDGDACTDGDILAEVAGKAASLLTAERTVLNFLQHLSGIATLTSQFVAAVEGTGVHVVDTRKTVPGLRMLEKQSVVHGGGQNHRMGLYDQYLIKDNHIAATGGVTQAIRAAKEKRQEGVLIEVEVRTEDELIDAIAEGPDIIMLDNWPIERIDECVRAIAGLCKVELSGGITLDNIRDYARKGIDYISSGALTHSATAVDINMTLRSLN